MLTILAWTNQPRLSPTDRTSKKKKYWTSMFCSKSCTSKWIIVFNGVCYFVAISGWGGWRADPYEDRAAEADGGHSGQRPSHRGPRAAA